MTSNETGLRFLKEAVPQLQNYLLSNELYWPLSGSLPRLTPGSLLLELIKMRVTTQIAGTSLTLRDEFQRLDGQFENLRSKWRTAWEKKMAREVTNRMRLWSQFLSDYLKDPDQSLDSYKTEARGRAILQLLVNELPNFPEMPALAELDRILKTRLIPGEFIWESELQPAFPKSDYWFLYGNL